MQIISSTKLYSWSTIAIIILALIAITIYQSNLTSHSNNYTQHNQQEYMDNLTVTHFNELGAIKDQITASHWEYISSLQYSTLTNPKLFLFKATGAQWIIQAKHAKAWHLTIDSKIDKLELKNQVIMSRLPANNFIPLSMTTEQIFYFPNKDFLETTKYVELKKPGLFLSGIGLKGYLAKDILKLLNNVTTNYEIIS